MLTDAIQEAHSLTQETPSKDPEYLESFIKRARISQKDLQYALTIPGKTLAASDYTEISGLIDDLSSISAQAEVILEAVRHELPQDVVEGNLDEFGELDIEKSVNALAAKVAVDTLGNPTSNRLYTGYNAFQEQLAVQLPEGYTEFPEQKFMEKLEEYLKMSDQKLAEEIGKDFPTKEWIGADPEPAVEHIPTDFEKEDSARANPAENSTDGEWEKNFEKERKFRGIDKAEDRDPDTGFHDDKTPGKTSDVKTAEDSDKSYNGDNTKNVGDNSEGVSESSPGSEPSSSGDGAQLETEAPTGGDSFESKIEAEAEKSHGAPRGPNRRTNKDVPAYSTPKDKLTAALKLVDSFENMDDKTAMAIVETVLGDTSEDGE